MILLRFRSALATFGHISIGGMASGKMFEGKVALNTFLVPEKRLKVYLYIGKYGKYYYCSFVTKYEYRVTSLLYFNIFFYRQINPKQR